MGTGKSVYSWKKVMTAREIITELVKNHWALIRVRGSHYIFAKNGEFVTIPFHKNVKRGTLESIKKQVLNAETKTQ